MAEYILLLPECIIIYMHLRSSCIRDNRVMYCQVIGLNIFAWKCNILSWMNVIISVGMFW